MAAQLTLKDALSHLKSLKGGHCTRLDKLIKSHEFEMVDSVVDFFKSFHQDPVSFLDDRLMPDWTPRTKVTGFQTLLTACTECEPIRECVEAGMGSPAFEKMKESFKDLIKKYTSESRKKKEKVVIVDEDDDEDEDCECDPCQCDPCECDDQCGNASRGDSQSDGSNAHCNANTQCGCEYYIERCKILEKKLEVALKYISEREAMLMDLWKVMFV